MLKVYAPFDENWSHLTVCFHLDQLAFDVARFILINGSNGVVKNCLDFAIFLLFKRQNLIQAIFIAKIRTALGLCV